MTYVAIFLSFTLGFVTASLVSTLIKIAEIKEAQKRINELRRTTWSWKR